LRRLIDRFHVDVLAIGCHRHFVSPDPKALADAHLKSKIVSISPDLSMSNRAERVSSGFIRIIKIGLRFGKFERLLDRLVKRPL